MAKLFCFGMGYTARRLAKRLVEEGWQVAGSTRSGVADETLQALNIRLFAFDGEKRSEEVSAALADCSHVLTSIPPQAGVDVLARFYGEELAALQLDWFGYLSTTGVYGDHQGGWVDEETPLTPSGRRGAARQAAEAQWLALAEERGLPLHIFRLPGIYGPKRSPLDRLRAGKAHRIIKPGQFFSRIHVDDLVQALIASMGRPQPPRVYNICDDEAAPPQDVISFGARLLDLPLPPEEDFETAEMSPMARSFYADSKKVSNRRMKAELGVQLLYPTYRDGLTALAQDGA